MFSEAMRNNTKVTARKIELKHAQTVICGAGYKFPYYVGAYM